MMNVLLTGGAGYIGSLVARWLISEGHRVTALDSLIHGGHALLGLYHEDNFDFVHGDVRAAAVIEKALAGADAVVHLAAVVGDPACARQPTVAREVNLDASLQLFEVAQHLGISRFVFASTCSNYGKMVDPSQYVTEESELRPISLYAETKVAVERALLDIASGNCPAVTVLRFATVFGLSPRMRFDLTVNEFAMELLIERKLMVYGEQFWRPYIHVFDAARAIALVLSSPQEKVGGRVFNVGDTEQNYRKGAIVDLICAQIDDPVEIEYVQTEEDPRDYRVSFERIGRELGFSITRTVEDGIREVIDVVSQGAITDFNNPYYRN
jgi:nucleoside-diphosphate-sugar epimerase|tara:strand:+ start:1485 stop:2459 length:975 start_codon:yes stop_codon:yes gene_type:complete